MFVKSLELKNFRNYDDLSITFDEDNNILFGDNAQGKTNTLEAIYVCGTTKSHKGCKDKELIKIGENESHIRMIVNKNGVDRKIDMHLRKNKTKGVAIDGIPIKKSIELCGLINIIFFSPENLNIIKNGPSERRRFIDMELCQIDKFYVDKSECKVSRNPRKRKELEESCLYTIFGAGSKKYIWRKEENAKSN